MARMWEGKGVVIKWKALWESVVEAGHLLASNEANSRAARRALGEVTEQRLVLVERFFPTVPP